MPLPTMTSTSLVLVLPFPPSVNHVWRRVGNKTLLSVEGRKFRRDVYATVRKQWMRVPRLENRLAVDVLLNPPNRRRRDIDNYGGKALLDALTHAGVWLDDEQIDHLTIRRGDVTDPGRCTVTIEEMPRED